MIVLSNCVRVVRAATALVMATLILLCTSLTVLVFSPLALLRHVGVQNPVPFICGWGFRAIDLIVLRLTLDISIIYRDGTGVYDITPFKPQDAVVIIANHPSLPVTFATPSLVWNLGIRGCAAVIKSEFVTKWYLAWLGIPATLAGFALPIKREDREQAVRALSRGAHRLPFGKRPFGIVLFPDGSRPTAKKIAASWDQYAKKTGNPERYEPFTHTLIPKMLGLGTILQSLRDMGHHPRIIDLTVAHSCHMPDGLWSTLIAIQHTSLTVRRADITAQINVCRTPEELKQFLMNRWNAKNTHLKESVK